MSNPLTLKLERGAILSDVERRVLDQLVLTSRVVEGDRDLIREGENPSCVRLVMEGLACRYKMLPDGSRQIMALLVPGDFCDLNIAMLKEMDHSIGTLTLCRIVEMPSEVLTQLAATHAGIRRAFSWATLVDEAILRQWLVGMGKRSAARRMAHLFCELLLRLRVVGLASENAFAFPMTQAELGDVLGLSAVHVNRTIQSLREQGLVRMTAGRVTVPDVPALIDFSSFNAAYLHFEVNAGSPAFPAA